MQRKRGGLAFATLSGAKGSKVLGCSRNHIGKQLELDTSNCAVHVSQAMGNGMSTAIARAHLLLRTWFARNGDIKERPRIELSFRSLHVVDDYNKSRGQEPKTTTEIAAVEVVGCCWLKWWVAVG
jgi:hypothetical protein